MRVGGLADLKRWLWGRPAGDGLILLYHRVTEVNADPWGLCVSPQHFAEHLEVLRRHTQPIGLTGLVASVARRRVPRRAAVITLDDGYHDNLECAFPALARHGLPATYFLTTDVLPEGREFWWDELERLLLQPGKLPPTLTLTLDGQVCQWNLGAAVDYRDNDARQHRDWRTWHAAPTARHEIYFSLWHQLYRLAEAEKRRVLDELMVWAGATPANRGTHRCLSVPEIAQLAASDLVEIGAHSVTHSGLPQLPLLKQRAEIRCSQARLQEITGRRLTSFSYPHGHHDEVTSALVREAGFHCACTTTHKVVGTGSDPFRLPRMQVLDWDGDQFARQLTAWQVGETAEAL